MREERPSVLLIVGSLSPNSVNATVSRVVESVGEPHLRFCAYGQLAEIPPFAHSDAGPIPASVAGLRALIDASDAVIIISPELGHSVPGVLKNLLDWLIPTGAMAGRPVGLITVSPTPTGGLRCLAALIHTLLAQSADPIAMLSIANVVPKIVSGELVHVPTHRRISEFVRAIADGVEERNSDINRPV